MNIVRNIYDSPWMGTAFNIAIAILVGCVIGVSVLISPIIIPILVVLAAATYFLIPRPMIACSLLIIVTTFTSAMPRGKIIPMLAPNELMLVGAVGLLALRLLIKRTEKPLAGGILFGSLALILGTVVVPIVAFTIMGHRFSIMTIFKLSAPIQYLLVFWLFATVPQSDADRMKFVQLMFVCASGVALIGLLQGFRISPIVNFLRTWYPSGQTEAASNNITRITSVFAAWNVLGGFLMLILLLLAALQNEKLSSLYKKNMIVTAVLCLFALLASGSYSSIVGFVVGLIIVKIIDPRGLKVLLPMFVVAGLGLIILAPLIGGRLLYQFERSESGFIPQTLEFRIEVWRDIYIPLILERPIWGYSPTLQNLAWAYPESQYLLLLFRSGLVSLVGFFIWLGTLFVWLSTIIRGAMTPMRSVAIAVFAVLISLSIMGITGPVFTWSGVVDYVWILLGLIASEQKDKLHLTL